MSDDDARNRRSKRFTAQMMIVAMVVNVSAVLLALATDGDASAGLTWFRIAMTAASLVALALGVRIYRQNR